LSKKKTCFTNKIHRSKTILENRNKSHVMCNEKVFSYGRCEDCGNFDILELDEDGLYKCENCALSPIYMSRRNGR
jgi:hypothetical protein